MYKLGCTAGLVACLFGEQQPLVGSAFLRPWCGVAASHLCVLHPRGVTEIRLPHGDHQHVERCTQERYRSRALPGLSRGYRGTKPNPGTLHAFDHCYIFIFCPQEKRGAEKIIKHQTHVARAFYTRTILPTVRVKMHLGTQSFANQLLWFLRLQSSCRGMCRLHRWTSLLAC